MQTHLCVTLWHGPLHLFTWFQICHIAGRFVAPYSFQILHHRQVCHDLWDWTAETNVPLILRVMQHFIRVSLKPIHHCLVYKTIVALVFRYVVYVQPRCFTVDLCIMAEVHSKRSTIIHEWMMILWIGACCWKWLKLKPSQLSVAALCSLCVSCVFQTCHYWFWLCMYLEFIQWWKRHRYKFIQCGKRHHYKIQPVHFSSQCWIITNTVKK